MYKEKYCHGLEARKGVGDKGSALNLWELENFKVTFLCRFLYWISRWQFNGDHQFIPTIEEFLMQKGMTFSITIWYNDCLLMTGYIQSGGFSPG